MARIASLHIYPVKSCRGIDVTAARVARTGLDWDRRWMLVDDEGTFVSQRSHPLLATIATSIARDVLELSADRHPALRIATDAGGDARRVRIWKDHCGGIDAGDEAARWFSRVVGDELRLVRFDDAEPRLADPRYAGPGQPVAFPDGYPLLLISRESLVDLNSRLPRPVPMDRFRPNVVIDGVPAYAEDSAADFCSGAVRLRAVKPCLRCIVPTTDQREGTRDPDGEPFKTLRGYRYDPALHGVAFGQNCVIEDGVGAELQVGAELTLDAHQV